MVKTLIKYELVINRALRSALMYDTAEQQINEFISFLGRQIGSDRIYIFEDNEKTRTTSNTYEWCALLLLVREKAKAGTKENAETRERYRLRLQAIRAKNPPVGGGKEQAHYRVLRQKDGRAGCAGAPCG